jgi:hypothetical protein
MGTNKYYELISSIDMQWEQGLSFTEKMLRIAFSNYGKIEKIKIENKRNRATIVFNSIEACTKVAQEFKHPLITVCYHLEPSKREHLLKALNKQKVDKIDLSVNSENIERLKELVNRGSGIYKQFYKEDS